jgi:hypothetical protein
MSGQEPDEGDDFSIIHVPNTLARKAKKVEGTLNDLLASADAKLSGMKQEFSTVIDAVIAELPVILAKQWQDPARRDAAIKAFSGAANSLKGKSGSFGYGVLGEVADLFRDYVSDTPADQQQAAAITNYVTTLQLLWKQRIEGDGGALGRRLVADLTELNRKARVP